MSKITVPESDLILIKKYYEEDNKKVSEIVRLLNNKYSSGVIITRLKNLGIYQSTRGKIPDNIGNNIIAEYNKGNSIVSLSKQFGYSTIKISTYLKNNDIIVINRQNIINYDLDKDIIPLYNQGYSLTKLAEIFHTNRNNLAKKLKARGIEIINHQNETKFNEHIFDVIDTEEKAYWLGFIFADGYIDSSPLEENKKSRYGFEISLKGSDAEHLHKFNEFMGHNKDNVKIGYVNCNGKRCVRCRWYVANKHLWNTLNSLGCTPRKSLILKFPEKRIFQDTSLIRHFIRGYFDGDGCLSYYKNIKTFSPICTFLGTKEFLQVLCSYCELLTDRTINHKSNENVYEVSCTHNIASKLLHYLYDDANIYLQRKYNRAIFLWDGCRSLEKLSEFLQTNIGEGCDANTEITTETKESVASQSVELEPEKSE